jgi:hypothetical protein
MKKNLPFHHVWTIICSRASIDADNNNVSLFNLIERLTFTVTDEMQKQVKGQNKKGVLFPIEFEMVSRFRRSTTEKVDFFDTRFRVENSESETIASIDRKMAVKSEIKNLRIRTQFTQFPAIVSGVYWFVTEAKKVEDASFQELNRIPLDVIVKFENDENKQKSKLSSKKR